MGQKALKTIQGPVVRHSTVCKGATALPRNDDANISFDLFIASWSPEEALQASDVMYFFMVGFDQTIMRGTITKATVHDQKSLAK